MIYEGSNEIQVIDLLVRKVPPDGCVAITTLLAELDKSCHGDVQVLRLNADVQSTTGALPDAAKYSIELPFWVADDYLRLMALALQAWTQIAPVAGKAAAGLKHSTLSILGCYLNATCACRSSIHAWRALLFPLDVASTP